ncbi:ShlB/FhaC/HecB family hemolysin secretion/activation protein [Burkholderia vietnamiensis]|uniref:Hemolysin activation/secretion protein-like protein n=1 Tax=Burkholderia vietnamiensis (strain G4 / LMG 22486) TaxID=269482 RepID=A4JFI9_BURVG|nr:Hemolysin activation/secretion protein-like protein [Burkholderia vietnamiensis G4]MCB4344802.1 ShlB/FhaC/HecB family hemolysin secretion/activation protein [Burkholderia vietnamiensis]
MTDPRLGRATAHAPSTFARLRARPIARAIAWALIASMTGLPCIPALAAVVATASGSGSDSEPGNPAQGAASQNGATATQGGLAAPDASESATLGGAVTPDGFGVAPVDLLGWRVESNDAKLLDAATGDWHEQDAKPLGVDVNGRADAKALAVALQARALSAGFASVYTQVDPNRGVIRLNLLPVHITQSGRNDYLRFFTPIDGKPASASKLAAATRLTQESAAINGDHVAITLSNPTNPMSLDAAVASGNARAAAAGTDTGDAMPLSIESQPADDQKTYGGALAFSTYGQRYSGRDTLTESGYARITDGVQANVSASQGLPGLPPHGDDSNGGRFYSESAGVRGVTPWGIGSLLYSHTDYRQGGPDFRDFDINGTIDRLDAQFERPLSQGLSVFFGLSAATQRQSIGVAGLDDRQNLLFAQAGINYQGAIGILSGRVMQGLAGSDKYNLAPLSGPFDSHFTAVAIDARKSIALAPRWTLDLSASAQAGSSGTPSVNAFYLGGLDRGRGYTTGNLAGSDGVAASATIGYAVHPLWTLYAGIDGGIVKPAEIGAQTESSVFVGVKTSHPIRMGHVFASMDFGFAKPLNGPAGERKSPTFGAFLTLGF